MSVPLCRPVRGTGCRLVAQLIADDPFVVARDGRHWHAEARTWKDGEHVAWFAACTADGEQAALDLAIDYVLKGLQPPTGGSINLSNALREGKRH